MSRETTVGELTPADLGKTITFVHSTVRLDLGPAHVHTDTGVLERMEFREVAPSLRLYRVWVEGATGYWSFFEQARCTVHD